MEEKCSVGPSWPAEPAGSPWRVRPLPRRLRPVLMELFSGVPDTTASRRLNMSPRTYSRRVAELLGYLGVATRFQAGVEIVRRGWAPDQRLLPPPGDRVTRPPLL